MDNRTKAKKKKLYIFIILERIYVGKADFISYENVLEYLLQIRVLVLEHSTEAKNEWMLAALAK